MLMIRFQRIGRTNDASFRIVAVEQARAAKSGRISAQLGSYNPRSKAFLLDEAALKARLAAGAKLSPSLHNLLVEKRFIEGAQINVVAPSAHKLPEPEAPAEAGDPDAASAPAAADEAPAPADEPAPAPAE
jgi:small subunit ribosomal protein S16